jgi:hypothetical protein
MNRLFTLKDEKAKWRSLLLTTEAILLVNQFYGTSDEFLENFNKKGLLKLRLDIPLSNIIEIGYPEKSGSSMRINYLRKNKSANVNFFFENQAEQQEFIFTVLTIKKMTATTKEVSILKAIIKFLIGLLVTAFFIVAIYKDAQKIEMGGAVATSGEYWLIEKLLAWLAKILGTEGTLFAGSALGLIWVYFIYRNLRLRPLEVVYS